MKSRRRDGSFKLLIVIPAKKNNCFRVTDIPFTDLKQPLASSKKCILFHKLPGVVPPR